MRAREERLAEVRDLLERAVAGQVPLSHEQRESLREEEHTLATQLTLHALRVENPESAFELPG